MNKNVLMLAIATLAVTAIGLAVVPALEEQQATALNDNVKNKLKEKADNLKNKAKDLKTKVKDKINNGDSVSGGGGFGPPCQTCPPQT